MDNCRLNMCKDIGGLGNKVTVSILLILLMFTSSIISLMHNIPLARSDQAWVGGAIYIRADGSIYPPDAPIVRKGNTYILTDDIMALTNGIIIDKDDIVIDGAGHAVFSENFEKHRHHSGCGIIVDGRRDIKIRNIRIYGFRYGILSTLSSRITISSSIIENNEVGIELRNSVENHIDDNIIRNNSVGISLYLSTGSYISTNNVEGNGRGIYLSYSLKNIVSDNIVRSGGIGIVLEFSSDNEMVINSIEHNDLGIQITYSYDNLFKINNLVNNTHQVSITDTFSANTWMKNYWSDYKGVDERSGPNQDQPGSDGIGDTLYIINDRNVEKYPLMEPVKIKVSILMHFPSTVYIGEKVVITGEISPPLSRGKVMINITGPERAVIYADIRDGKFNALYIPRTPGSFLNSYRVQAVFEGSPTLMKAKSPVGSIDVLERRVEEGWPSHVIPLIASIGISAIVVAIAIYILIRRRLGKSGQ